MIDDVHALQKGSERHVVLQIAEHNVVPLCPPRLRPVGRRPKQPPERRPLRQPRLEGPAEEPSGTSDRDTVHQPSPLIAPIPQFRWTRTR